MTPPTSREGLLAKAQYFVDCKYVARSDERQKSMGLAYVEAERQDLAREIVNFAETVLHGFTQTPLNRGAMIELLSNAYNEGFGEGMREQTSHKGGWPWNSRKQKYGALLDKICAPSPPNPREAKP